MKIEVASRKHRGDTASQNVAQSSLLIAASCLPVEDVHGNIRLGNLEDVLKICDQKWCGFFVLGLQKKRQRKSTFRVYFTLFPKIE